MVHQDEVLDGVFAALANPVRRRTLDALGAGERSAGELAAPHDMSLPGFLKHLQVLRDAGLIACRKEGRTLQCTLASRPLSKASRWLGGREALWNDRLDALGRHLYQREQVSSRAGRRDTKKGSP